MNARVRALAHTIWDYHRLDHRIVPSDVILVLCSHDMSVAARGALRIAS